MESCVTLSLYYPVSVLLCYFVTLLLCFFFTFLVFFFVPRRISLLMLRTRSCGILCYFITLLPCFCVTLLFCNFVSFLPFYFLRHGRLTRSRGISLLPPNCFTSSGITLTEESLIRWIFSCV